MKFFDAPAISLKISTPSPLTSCGYKFFSHQIHSITNGSNHSNIRGHVKINEIIKSHGAIIIPNRGPVYRSIFTIDSTYNFIGFFFQLFESGTSEREGTVSITSRTFLNTLGILIKIDQKLSFD